MLVYNRKSEETLRYSTNASISKKMQQYSEKVLQGSEISCGWQDWTRGRFEKRSLSSDKRSSAGLRLGFKRKRVK